MNEEYNPTESLPTITDLPYFTSGNDQLEQQGYSSAPTSVGVMNMYKPDYSSGTRDFVENLRTETLNSLYSPKQDTLSSIISVPNDKIDISGGYARANEVYDTLNDGTLLPKYEMYKTGINNEDYNASMQSGTEKFFNPITRGITKVGRGIFADIGSFIYGVGEATLTGRAESLFDNSMAKYVDDLDKKTDFAYKNYYTEAQNGLGANLYTWEKVLGGAEFTARMLGAEAVIAVATGGTSLPSSFARAGLRLGIRASELSRTARGLRIAETLEDVIQTGRRASEVTRIATEPIATVARQGGGVFSADRYARGLESAISAGKIADNLKQARFAVTGSAYEAGFEARHYQEEAENAFWEYHRANGIEPTQEQIADFQEKLDKTTWGVFGANMGILSVSNMALFGNMLNIKNPFQKLATNSFFDRSVFRIGTERTAEGIWRPLKSNFFNKALAYSAPIAKGAFVEGVFEEGGQGIASGMMKNYISSTYDPKAMKETANYASAFTKAFKDQYSTKEGLEEVVIGGIIGGLFGGIGGIRQTNAQYRNQEFVAQVQNAMPQVADSIVSNLYTNENLSNIFGHSNRLQTITENIERAKENGDITGSALHSAESFISMLQASTSVGKTDEFMTILKDSLRGMSAEQLAQGQGISLDAVEDFKNDKIAGIEGISENYSKAREAGEYIFGRGSIGGFYEVEGKRVNRQNLIDAFAYTSAMGGVAQQVAGDSFTAFQQKLSEIGTSREISEQFGAIGALQSAGQLELARYTQATQEESELLKQRDKLTDQILRTQREEQTPDTVDKLQKLAQQLTDLGTEISTASSNKDLYWKSIADNFYRNLGQNEGGFLPQIDFDNFNNQTKDLQEYLNNSSLTEFDKVELNKLLNEFNKANTAFKSFNSLANSISDPKFTFKTYNNLFSGLRAKNDTSLNELTKDTLINLYNTDSKVGETITTYQPTPSLVTQEIVDNLSDTEYQLPENIIQFLSDKIRNNQALSENERQVYNSNKEVIDELANRVITDPILEESEGTEVSQTTAEITSRRNELKQLKKGIITDAVQSEIDRINSEIKTLQDEVVSLTEADNQVLQEEDNTETINILEKRLSDLNNRRGRLLDQLERIESTASDSNSLTDKSVDDFAKENNDDVLDYKETDFNGDTAIVYNTQQDNSWQGKGSSFRKTWNVLKFNQGTYTHVRILMTEDQKLRYDSKEKVGFSEELRRLARENRNANYVTLIDIRPKSERVSENNSTYSVSLDNINNQISDLEKQIRKTQEDLNDTYLIDDSALNLIDAEVNPRFAEIENSINDLTNLKEFLVSDRIDDLETEIEELKSKQTADKKLAKRKENLSLKIANLRSQILMEISKEGINNIDETLLDTKKPYYAKLRKMRRLEAQLRDLNNIKEEFNPDASYRDQLQWVVDNSNILEYENVETLSSVSPPPEEIVNRYLELDAKKRKTKTEKEEFANLREELLPYKLVEGSYFGSIPLVDIINVYNQANETQQLDDSQVERLTESEVQETIKKVQNQESTPEFRSPEVGLVYDGVYLKGGEGVQGIYHIKLETMLNAGIANGLLIEATEFTEDENGLITYGEPETIDGLNIEEASNKYDNFQGVKIQIGDNITLERSVRGTNFVVSGNISELLGLTPYAITGQPNAYNLLYEQKSDGTWSAKESEYEVTRDGNVVPFDKETLNSIKPGDEVTLFYDANDDYNKTLKRKDRVNKANIYIMKNGNLVNILKAVPNYKDKNESWSALADLRKEVIENGTATIKVKNSYVGLPNISINEDGKAIELPIDESMVESYGYMDGEGNYNFFNNVNPTNTQYTDPYSEFGKNIPIVAFNYNGKIYTFPIQISSASFDATGELDNILNNENLNEYQKVFQINSLLNKYDLMSDELRLSNQNDTLGAIREALTSVGGKTDVTNREDVQNADKTILLDMSDPFMSAKLVLDLQSSSEILDSLGDTNLNTPIEPSSDIGSDLADENKC